MKAANLWSCYGHGVDGAIFSAAIHTVLETPLRACLLAVVFALGWTAHPQVIAADEYTAQVSDIVQQQTRLRAEVEAGKGPFEELPVAKRKELLTKQENILRSLEGMESIDDLGAEQRVEVEADLAWIEALVAAANDERMICHREKTIGSNRTTRVCRTAAQVERARAQARQQVTTDIQNTSNR